MPTLILRGLLPYQACRAALPILQSIICHCFHTPAFYISARHLRWYRQIHTHGNNHPESSIFSHQPSLGLNAMPSVPLKVAQLNLQGPFGGMRHSWRVEKRGQTSDCVVVLNSCGSQSTHSLGGLSFVPSRRHASPGWEGPPFPGTGSHGAQHGRSGLFPQFIERLLAVWSANDSCHITFSLLSVRRTQYGGLPVRKFME